MKRKRCPGHQSRARRGFSLVWFAMILFALMGMAALVIDLGIARVTQRQLQSAADSAALGYLRGETATSVTGHATRVFDSGLPTSIGAAPGLTFLPGYSLSQGFEASQTIVLNEAESYVTAESLELQLANQGTQSTAALQTTIPYLFGRSSLLNLQSRGAGILVRGEACGEGTLAFVAGRSFVDDGIPGVLPIAIELGAWDSVFTADAETLVEVQPDGTLNVGQSYVGFIWSDSSSPPAVIVGESKSAISQAPILISGVGYVPLMSDLGVLGNRIVGFGFVVVDSIDGIRLEKRIGQVAQANLSSTLPREIDGVFRDESDDPHLSLLLQRMREAAWSDPGQPELANCRVALAPALASLPSN